MPKKWIMLVEDDSDHVALILRALKRHGVTDEVVVMLDGEEALDYLYSRGLFSARPLPELPTLVLLDLKLPKVNGLEVLQHIRADERTRFLPVVVLTSSDEQRDVQESYRLGTNSYVRKPVDFIQFMEAMHQLVQYWLNLNQVPNLE
ncbi:MAG TPA: response regulator [Symbiobacteriaceae bacterium]|jgi:CheY-like chemotaxis protein